MKAARVLQQARRPTPTCLSQQARTRLHNNSSSAFPSPFSFFSLRNPCSNSIRRIPNKRFSSSKSPFNPTPHLNSPEPSLSLSQRFKKLSREYGWSALGVYLLLTALDLPFCFLAVRWLGTERIGHWEHVILAWFWRIVPYPLPATEEPHDTEPLTAGKKPEEYGVVASKGEEVGVPTYDHDVVEAEKRNSSEDASIWTQLALAYAVHKSFIFLRVPLTAAVTPRVVKTLRGWGWDIGKRRPTKGVKDVKTD
ncbi:MAG: hypothetical protein HETSPECPRED_004796 [Heterodermia speciosa]|uniref:DUF1279 domain-containing protein n=1 Tax=Heterodermia speciosa TaxID=116794 RepID=A0A8H3I669_9LECA|nr:MAG: hypothetical protein HETSPECPRED_004796 [Heterodermia speciosa]